MKLIVAVFVYFVLTLSFVIATSQGPPSCSDEVIEDIKLKHERELPLLSKEILGCFIGFSKINYRIEGSIYSTAGNKYEYAFQMSSDNKISYIEYPKFKSEENMVKFVDFVENLDRYKENEPLFNNPERYISNMDPIVGYSSITEEGYIGGQELWFYYIDNKLYAYPGHNPDNEISEASALDVYDVSELNLSSEKIEVGTSEFEEIVDQSKYKENKIIFYLIVLIIILIIVFVLFKTFKKMKSSKV